MFWSRRRQRRAVPLPLPGVCGLGRHTLRTEHLLLYTPETMLDLVAVYVAASDVAAQRWLGWEENRVQTDVRVRKVLLRLRPGDPGPPPAWARPLLADQLQDHPLTEQMLIGVRLDDGRYAGATELNVATGEIGGWLAPHARGHGFGRELFLGAALLGHTHLGLRTVRAGYEPANVASGRALLGAGFVADAGPARHTLANGREIEARWLRHTASGPVSRCPGARLPPGSATGGSVSGPVTGGD